MNGDRRVAGVDWGGISVFITALTGLVGTVGALWIQSKRIERGDRPGGPRHLADDEPPPAHPMTVEQIVDIVEERERRKGKPRFEMRLTPRLRAKIIS